MTVCACHVNQNEHFALVLSVLKEGQGSQVNLLMTETLVDIHLCNNL